MNLSESALEPGLLSDKAVFREESAGYPSISASIGLISTDKTDEIRLLSREEAAELKLAFMDAFYAAFWRGDAILSPLGADRVHAWPGNKTLAFVQNWKAEKAFKNSWGLDDLVLAVAPRNIPRVSLVKGPLLNAFGLGEGEGRANGVQGYGAPLTDEYSYKEGRAQRFEKGLLVVEASGNRLFIPEKAPSEDADIDPAIGLSSDTRLSAQFRAAYLVGLNLGLPALSAAGPLRLVPLSPRQGIPVEGVWIQELGSDWALLAPLIAGRVLRPCILAKPFLSLFLSKGSWESSLAFFGVPLSDPFPQESRVLQRFSQGFMEQK
ncbi:hypothetical protein MASR2M78_36020 [Treponema sp.]